MSTVPYELWRKALIIWEKEDGKIGRHRLAKLLQIPESLARNILFALRNRDFLSLKVEEQCDLNDEEIELILSDLHIPFHDKLAVELVFDYLEKERIEPTIITILGDLVDFYKISDFVHNPTSEGIGEELEIAREFLVDLRSRYPNARIIYYEGNHEQRLNRYVVKNAKEIYELVEDLIEVKLGLENLNIEYVTKPFRIGRLWHLHGHEKVRGGYNPEYITNVIWKYVHDNFIVGHFHRNQEKVFKNIAGDLYWGGAVGHLATTFEYAILNNWTQGFCVVKYDSDGRFKANVKTIHEGIIF